MTACCSVCHELLAPSDNSYAAKCGHVLHLPCWTNWLWRNSNCPECRRETSKEELIRLFFNKGNQDDVESFTLESQQKFEIAAGPARDCNERGFIDVEDESETDTESETVEIIDVTESETDGEENRRTTFSDASLITVSSDEVDSEIDDEEFYSGESEEERGYLSDSDGSEEKESDSDEVEVVGSDSDEVEVVGSDSDEVEVSESDSDEIEVSESDSDEVVVPESDSDEVGEEDSDSEDYDTDD